MHKRSHKTQHTNMLTSELVFIPSPGAGHLPQTVELAQLLLRHDHRLSATIIIMHLPESLGATYNDKTDQPYTPRLRFTHIPCDDSTKALITPTCKLLDLLDHNRPHFRDIVRSITESDSVGSVVGFIFDMFCMEFVDLADEFGAPAYTYFTCPSALLRLMLYLQAKRDDEGFDVMELENAPDTELSLLGFVNPVPVKVFPEVVFRKDGCYAKTYLDLARLFRASKGILINTFHELESYGLESLLISHDVPPVFPVGPIINLEKKKHEAKTDEIMQWLNEQPDSSVVFLCFGSMGTFDNKQVKEMAVALERSGHRFLWALREAAPKGKLGYPREYDNLEEVLPDGFLERTSGMGKIIGWAPQMAVLAHPSVGGFVSHCGWNSTLESMWCGVPMAAWPSYSEQQLNAFMLVMELGLAVEIRMDYLIDTTHDRVREPVLVTAEEIEGGIRKLMSDGEMRKKVTEMKEKSRAAVAEDGSSYKAVGNFIDHVMTMSATV